MKYEFIKTILEGPVKQAEKGFTQKVSIVASLQKDNGEEIMKLTDTIDVQLTSDSISQCQADIEKTANNFLQEKYSG